MGKAAAPSLCVLVSVSFSKTRTLFFWFYFFFYLWDAQGRVEVFLPGHTHEPACRAMNRKRRRKRAWKVSMPAALPGQGPDAQGAATPSPSLAALTGALPGREAGPQHCPASLSPAPIELGASLGPHPATHAPLAVKRDANAVQLRSRNCKFIKIASCHSTDKHYTQPQTQQPTPGGVTKAGRWMDSQPCHPRTTTTS